MEYAEWLHIRNPKKRRNTTLIDMYDMSIPHCVPIVFSVDKWEVGPAVYDQITAWISGALRVPALTCTFVPNDREQSSKYGLLAASDDRIEFEDGVVCISRVIEQYSKVWEARINSKFITLFSDALHLEPDDLGCIRSIRSDLDMIPTREQVGYMVNRFGAFASSIESHYPAEFPAYVLWCRSDLVNRIRSYKSQSVPIVKFEHERPILQCTTGFNHDWELRGQ